MIKGIVRGLAALQALGLEPPQILDDARDKQFFLVDHFSYAHAIDHMD